MPTVSSPAAAPLTLTRTPRRKLAETVAEQMIEAIHSLKPGDKLPSEAEFTQMLGVGRSTVREALNGLASLGLVEARHGAGVFVATEPPAPTPEHSEIAKALAKGVTRELLEAREIIEVAIARLAAQRRTDADVREIAAVLEAHRRSLATPAKPAMQFHIVLAEAAHNEVLAGMFKSFVKLMVKRGPGLYAKLKNFGQWELEEHRSIFEAVRDGNADEAARRMAGHVKAMATHYRKVGSA